jgi:hypothetical protein
MINFANGPAAGSHLMLRRAPYFLRVVRSKKSGEIDALDQLGDEPSKGEELFAYQQTWSGGMVHLLMSPRSQSGFYAQANYELVPEQPSDAEMRTNEAWQKWCYAHAPVKATPTPTAPSTP